MSDNPLKSLPDKIEKYELGDKLLTGEEYAALTDKLFMELRTALQPYPIAMLALTLMEVDGELKLNLATNNCLCCISDNLVAFIKENGIKHQILGEMRMH